MPGHNSIYLELAECGCCHSSLPPGDVSVSRSGSTCCSPACAALVDEAAGLSPLPEMICTNCEGACPNSQHIVFSEDGLPFCGEECAGSYPKMVSAPEVRRVLCTAAASMFLAAGTALLVIAGNVSRLTRHP